MNATVKEAEKFAAKTLTEDGLIDIFTGVGLILIGWFWLVDNSGISAIIPFALINIWKVTRNKITIPRTGSVTLAKETEATILTGRVILGIITTTLVIGVIAWVLGGAGDITGTVYYPLFASGPSLLIATLLFFTAKHLQSKRFYFYTGWLVVAAGLAILVGAGPATAVIIGGIPFLFLGTWTHCKFLADHPKETS